jgi:hypothetical protein
MFKLPAQASQWATRANTTHAVLEHTKATIMRVEPANHHPPHTRTCAQTEPPSICHDDSLRHGCSVTFCNVSM